MFKYQFNTKTPFVSFALMPELVLEIFMEQTRGVEYGEEITKQ